MSRLMIVEVPSYSAEFKGIREVQELVRCKECKWFVKHNCTKGRERIYTWRASDDFCSYGEREGE